MITKYGGIVSVDNLENQRKSGVKDDAIADQMAQESPVFASQLSKIRKKYNGDSAATTAFLNTKWYGVVDHSPEQPKGIVGRSLERIYNNYKKDIVDIGQSLEDRQQGEQGFIDTAGQVAGNLASIAFSPVAQPFQEAFGTAAKGAYENIPGVKPALQSLGQSSIVQKGILPAIQGTSQFLQQESQRNPALRTLGAVGEGLADATDFYAGTQIARAGAKATIAGAKMIPQLPRMAGQAAGTALRVGTQPIRSGFSGFMQGVRGQADDVTKAVSNTFDDATMELTGKAQEAVKAGMDEKVMKFVVQQNPETKRAMLSMVKAAKKGAEKLGGDTAHKEILGQYMLNNIDHVLTEKSTVGKALGAMKKGMSDEVIDMTDDLVGLQTKLRNAGAIINEKGVITRLAAESDDNIPMLQEALNFLQPDDAGRVVRRFGDVDMWRSKMFKEMKSAKAKLQPSASGQSAFDYADKVVNGLRRSAIKNASKSNPRLLAYNDAFEELSTQASTFLKSIGYKGKLNIDDITAKDLRTGEVALRSLGNASADVRESFQNLINTARKYGMDSNVDEMGLVRWADTLEDIFPITPTRSLQGGVTRGTRDALGNFTEDVIKGGAKRGVIEAGSAKVMEVVDKMRGMTPENQYKLLIEVLEAPSDTPMVKILNTLDDVPQSVKDASKGIDAGDMKPTASSLSDELSRSGSTENQVLGKDLTTSPTTLPPQSQGVNPLELPRKGATGKQNMFNDFGNLTPEEIARLTPEEKATGLIGGSDSVKTVTAEDLVKSARKDSGIAKAIKDGGKEYQIIDVPMDKISYDYSGQYFENPKASAETIAKYTKTKGSPVILNAKGEVIDGNHRALAALSNGETSIQAYVPKGTNISSFDNLNTRLQAQGSSYENYFGKSKYATPSPLPSVGGGKVIPKELEPLAKEAMKFKKQGKTASDFAESFKVGNKNHSDTKGNVQALLGEDGVKVWQEQFYKSGVDKPANALEDIYNLANKSSPVGGGLEPLAKEARKGGTLYHGTSSKIDGELKYPLYALDNSKTAGDYATGKIGSVTGRARGGSTPNVIELKPNPNARVFDLRNAADRELLKNNSSLKSQSKLDFNGYPFASDKGMADFFVSEDIAKIIKDKKLPFDAIAFDDRGGRGTGVMALNDKAFINKSSSHQ